MVIEMYENATNGDEIQRILTSDMDRDGKAFKFTFHWRN